MKPYVTALDDGLDAVIAADKAGDPWFSMDPLLKPALNKRVARWYAPPAPTHVPRQKSRTGQTIAEALNYLREDKC
jgi:hypothetical protein